MGRWHLPTLEHGEDVLGGDSLRGHGGAEGLDSFRGYEGALHHHRGLGAQTRKRGLLQRHLKRGGEKHELVSF